MKIISTKVHGVLDYLVAILLIISPWALGFSGIGSATWMAVGFGVFTIIYSLLTSYEWGIWEIITMRGHLILDSFSGILLATSPLIFGFSELVYLPHLAIGISEILITAITNPQTSDEKRNEEYNKQHRGTSRV